MQAPFNFDQICSNVLDGADTTSISHNLAIWRAINGGLSIALESPIEFDPRADWWRRPEIRFGIAYLGRLWPKWPLMTPEHEALLANFSLGFMKACKLAEKKNPAPFFGVDYERGGGVAKVIAPLHDVLSEFPEIPGWEDIRPSNSAWKTPRDSIDSALRKVEKGRFEAIERPLRYCMRWWPTIKAETLQEFEAQQRFFWAYRIIFTSNNAYSTGGAQAFGPVIGNTPTTIMLKVAKAWSEGQASTEQPLMGLARSDDTPEDRSHYNTVRETWGFLNLHRSPFYNNQANEYRTLSESPEQAVQMLGIQTRDWLAANPEKSQRLAEVFIPLLRDARRNSKSAFGQARRWDQRKDRGSLFDAELRQQLVDHGVHRANELAPMDRAAILMHLGLDASVHPHETEPVHIEDGHGTEPAKDTQNDPGYQPVEPGSDSLRSAERVWIYAPGRNASRWDGDRDGNVMSIGWTMTGDLAQYESQQQLQAYLEEISDSDTRQRMAAKTCWDFSHEVQIGDPVIARKGRHKILGIGVVTGAYTYVSGETHPHRIDVRWVWTGDYEIATTRFLAIKTLVQSSRRKALLQELEVLVPKTTELDRGDDPGTLEEPYELEDALADLFMSEAEVERMLGLLERKKNLIIQGPPGVGKTFVAKRLAYLLMGEQDSERVEVVQFHQAYTYEQFIRGYRPTKDGNFELATGPLYDLAERAQGDPDSAYVLVIDEINRGNLSKILGEAMLLLEADKRSDQWGVRLAYSSDVGEDEREEPFYLPDNLFIIGTMNTADRSLAVVDYALRRRFVFADVKPGLDSPRFEEHLAGFPTHMFAKLREQIGRLNTLIRNDANLGAGFEIGHSYFCAGDNESPKPWANDPSAWIKEIMTYELEPLLREYWYDDKAQLQAALQLLAMD